jgi:PAS domain S-box-containing protein
MLKQSPNNQPAPLLSMEQMHHQELETLKAEKAQLELLLEVILAHADYIENQLFDARLQLQESERKLTQIINAMPVGVVVVDANGSPYYHNNKANQLLGKDVMPVATPAQLTENYQLYLTNTEQLYPTATHPLLRALNGEISNVDDMEIRRPDQTILPIEVWGSPIFDEQGHLTYAIAAFQDITARKQAERKLQKQHAIEQALLESQQRLAESLEIKFRDLVANVPGVIYQAYARSNGETGFYYVSPRFEELYGIKATDLQRDWHTLPVHPEDLPSFVASVQQAITDRQDWSFEGRFLLATGEIKWWRGASKPVMCDDAEILFNGILIDITEHKQAEDALRKSEEKFSKIFQHSPDSIQMTRLRDNKFMEVNDTFVQWTGYQRSEVIGKTALELNFWVNLEDKDKFFQELSDHGHCVNLETNFRAKGGHLIPAIVSASIVEIDGELRVLSVVRDITALRQAKTKLKQAVEMAEQAKQEAEIANRTKSAFLANMSHELRTPLNGILGYTQILSRDNNLTDQQKNGIRIIHRSGEHLLTLVNDILDLSKIEAGKLELFPSEFNFHEFIQDIVDLFKMRAQQQGITLTYIAFYPLPSVVYADEKRLRQVLLNLLSNAIKFTHGTTGQVTFKVIYDNNRVRFEVEDTGVGIAAEHLNMIFLPFQQVGNQRLQTEGTGLGLSISKKLVTLMGGRLYVASLLGIGSLFWFDIPLPAIEKAVNISLRPPATVVGFKNTKEHQDFTILVIDDQWQSRAFLSNFLSNLGFRVLEANNGAEALEIAHEYLPEVIISDLIMPVMDGIELTRRLRQSILLKDSVIIINSASIFEQHQRDSLAAGCNAFIVKPINTERLLTLLQQYLPLEWLYDKPPETSLPILAPMVGPSPAQALALYDLVIIGDIQGIIDNIFSLEQQDAKLALFAQQVRYLTDNFEIEKLEKLVKQFVDNG